MKIVVILGPTGTGKSELSIALAKKMNAEIINITVIKTIFKILQ